MLQRPARRLGEVPRLYPEDGPWLLTARDDMSQGPITPTPEIEAMMPGREGLFYARRIPGGWDIIAPLPAND